MHSRNAAALAAPFVPATYHSPWRMSCVTTPSALNTDVLVDVTFDDRTPRALHMPPPSACALPAHRVHHHTLTLAGPGAPHGTHSLAHAFRHGAITEEYISSNASFHYFTMQDISADNLVPSASVLVDKLQPHGGRRREALLTILGSGFSRRDAPDTVTGLDTDLYESDEPRHPQRSFMSRTAPTASSRASRLRSKAPSSRCSLLFCARPCLRPW